MIQVNKYWFVYLSKFCIGYKYKNRGRNWDNEEPISLTANNMQIEMRRQKIKRTK